MTHTSGTSGHVNLPANMNHACSSGSAMTPLDGRGHLPGHAGSSVDARGSPSDPGLLRNRAPDRPAPVTARSDMRRRLTAPARTGHPRTIATGSRPVPRSRPPVPGQRRPGHGGESAGDGRAQTMPASRQPGRGGAGRPGDRVLPPAGGRAPPRPALGDRQLPGPVSHPARTRSRASADTVRAPAADAGGAGPGSEASDQRRRAAADAGGAAALVPGTPPGGLNAAAAHPGQDGGRRSALPAGQHPARGALATGHGAATPHAS
jgi:hypothetical protein